MPNIVYQLFPRSIGMEPILLDVVDCFVHNFAAIDSSCNDLDSNAVLKEVTLDLEAASFVVEKKKTRPTVIINVPVLYGLNNSVDKCFKVDALSRDGRVVVEVEAGRAYDNNQFLKDVFEACMMNGVEYLVVAVRKDYRGKDDFSKIYTFFETLYINGRLKLPLKGILLIGY